MLTVPASKVSVPLTVVIRTPVNAAPRVMLPPEILPAFEVIVPATEVVSQVFPVTKQQVAAMLKLVPAPTTALSMFPAVDVAPLAPADALLPYPEVTIVEAPVIIWSKKLLVPLVLTLLIITVIRFTHAGKAVKSMLVPLVDATAVPD